MKSEEAHGTRLLVRHVGQAGVLNFEVQRVDSRGAKLAPGVELTDPLGINLGGSNLTLGHELAWYLESYLVLAEELRDFDAAEGWDRRALAVFEEMGDAPRAELCVLPSSAQGAGNCLRSRGPAQRSKLDRMHLQKADGQTPPHVAKVEGRSQLT